jgi:hypothetical protein
MFESAGILRGSGQPRRRDWMMLPLRRVLGTVLGVCALGAVGVAAPLSAQASLVSTTTCNSSGLTHPFAPWGDWFSYELAPGGNFESVAWSLSGGADRVRESFAVTGLDGSWSLSLPAGGFAESPWVCVNAAYPTMRFFIAGTGIVAVQVIYGHTTIATGVAVAAGGWRPTSVMLTDSAVSGTLAGGTAQVSLRLTAVSGDPQVDDVFIDPWNRG